MIQLVPHLKIRLCVPPVDFRKHLDGLAAICRHRFDADPLDGCVYAFRNRSGTMLRLLVHDGIGAWLITRRFSRGKVSFWPTADEASLHPMLAHELAVILYHGDPKHARFAEPWRKIS